MLQLILLEEDELLLKNLVKGVFVDDANDDVDESDDDLALAPVEAVLLAASKPDTRVEAEEAKPHIPPESDDESDGRGGWPSPSPRPRPRRARRVATTTTRDAVDPRAEVEGCKGGLNTTRLELDVSTDFADHDAQLEAIEVSLMERNNAEEAARDKARRDPGQGSHRSKGCGRGRE